MKWVILRDCQSLDSLIHKRIWISLGIMSIKDMIKDMTKDMIRGLIKDMCVIHSHSYNLFLNFMTRGWEWNNRKSQSQSQKRDGWIVMWIKSKVISDKVEISYLRKSHN